MPRLNHTWKKNKEFKPDGILYEKHDCTRCGCTKYKYSYKTKSGRYFEETFARDCGRTFDYNPECIDWSDNTLD